VGLETRTERDNEVNRPKALVDLYTLVEIQRSAARFGKSFAKHAGWHGDSNERAAN